MFTSKIICDLSNGREITLPSKFRLIPQYWSTSSYIPKHTCEGEEYGGYYDFDDGIIYEDDFDAICEYLENSINYDYTLGFSLKYEIEDHLDELNISVDTLKDKTRFEEFISNLISEFNISDEAIEIVLSNENHTKVINDYFEHGGRHIMYTNYSEKPDDIEYEINLLNTDNIYIGFRFSDLF